MGPVARGQRGVFKSVLLVIFVSQVIGSVAPMPQRGNVHFPPSNPHPPRQNIFPTPNPSANGIVPVDPSPNNNDDGTSIDSVPANEFQVGTTGIACDKPGSFVQAPDGCNRCFCAQNRQLSSACSRVFCPPGFPSTSLRQHRV